MRIAIGSDHRGYPLKEQLIGMLRSKGHEVLDEGTCGSESVDYPDFARAVGEAVARVSPRSDYVTRTKAAVLDGTIDDPEASTLAAAFVVTAIAAAAAGFAATLLFLMTRRRRS